MGQLGMWWDMWAWCSVRSFGCEVWSKRNYERDAAISEHFLHHDAGESELTFEDRGQVKAPFERKLRAAVYRDALPYTNPSPSQNLTTIILFKIWKKFENFVPFLQKNNSINLKNETIYVNEFIKVWSLGKNGLFHVLDVECRKIEKSVSFLGSNRWPFISRIFEKRTFRYVFSSKRHRRWLKHFSISYLMDMEETVSSMKNKMKIVPGHHS